MATIFKFIISGLFFFLTYAVNGHVDGAKIDPAFAALGAAIPVKKRGGASSSKLGEDTYDLPKNSVLERLRAQFPGYVISPSFIRQEREITVSNSPIAFNLKQTSESVPTAVELDDSDQFYCTKVGVFLKKTKGDTSPNHSYAMLHTYPNRAEFADGTKFKGEMLEAIYHGSLSVSTEQTTYIERLPMIHFRAVPEFPQGTTTASNATTTTFSIGVSPYMKGLSEISGFGVLQFNGRKRHEIRVTTPTDSSIVLVNDVAGMRNWLVLYLEGWLVKGAGRQVVK